MRLVKISMLFYLWLAFTASPVLAQLPGSSTGTGYIDLIFKLIWLVSSGIGFVMSFKISKAFKKGKLARPWYLFSVAFGVFILGSLAASAEYFRPTEGFGLVSGITSTVGILVLLSAGYLYKRAVLR